MKGDHYYKTTTKEIIVLSQNSNNCLLIEVKGESYFPSLKNSIQNIPEFNKLSINQDKGSIVLKDQKSCLVTKTPQYNGDVWLFGHGYSKLSSSEFSIFATFDSQKNQGDLFDITQLLELFSSVIQPKRLFLFACYQGKYLDRYAKDIPSLEEAYGFTTAANRSAAPSFVESYLLSKFNTSWDNSWKRA
ncbi:MAG: hypothetical protein ACM65M_24165 [Microcoleus sp.]